MSSYIEVKNVSKSFGGKAILQDVSLSIEQGTAVGLVGANGSGKSVLFKILCGFEKPDRGSVYVRGKQLGKNGRDFPESLGVFINSPGFIGIYSGFQNLKFLADIQGKIGEKEIRQAMSKVGLDPDNKTKVDNYFCAIGHPVSGSGFPEGFNAADGKIGFFQGLKNYLHTLTVDSLNITVLHQSGNGPADSIAGAVINSNQIIFRGKQFAIQIISLLHMIL